MAGKSAMERIKANAEIAKKTIDELKSEVSLNWQLHCIFLCIVIAA